jgi:uncharacterized protein (UPF0210 family)
MICGKTMPLIRSLTLGAPTPGRRTLERTIESVQILNEIRSGLEENEVGVETARITFPPVGEKSRVKSYTDSIFKVIENSEIDYFSAPIWIRDKNYAVEIRTLLQQHPRMFTNLPILDEREERGTVSEEAVRMSAGIIKDLSETDPFLNLRFCATAGVPPNVPFFPSSYGDLNERKYSLTIALETADLVVDAALETREEEPDFGSRFKRKYEVFLDKIIRFFDEDSLPVDWDFKGFDLSPAPFPEPDRSIGRGIELLSGTPFGSSATLAAIAEITSALQSMTQKGPGFHGVMLPVFEDNVLGERSYEGLLTVDKLLLYSTVCGTGLDTIPLPGETSERAISRLVRNTGILSASQMKPLTSRLMPIPGKEAGDLVKFDFEYFAPSGVMDPE